MTAMTDPSAPPHSHPLRRRPWPWLLPVLAGAVGVVIGVLITLLCTVLLSPEASGRSSTTAEAVMACGVAERDGVSFRQGEQNPEMRMSWAAAEESDAGNLDVANGDVRCVLDRLGASSAEVQRLLDSDRASASQVLEDYQVTVHLDDPEHQYADFQPTH
ncbi:hypothetical protein [Rothia halotolerans]|uniref:hypothetical protein n=1 Tax=Rothia halotolerans TaxID=405770 RepID=UPI00101BB41B|nr:hypothetical protein [Rothia halotolerans]